VLFTSHKTKMPDPADALPGRDERPFEVPARHAVLGAPLEPPFPDGLESAVFALGCFWGAERLFWTVPGVYTTAVGYTGGYTPNPTYEEVCSGRTGHAEAVLVVFDPDRVSYGDLLKVFFEEHDPTQGMRQGNDVGTQYRSAIFVTEDQKDTAERAVAAYDTALRKAGHSPVTTEISATDTFFYAEDYHQQYLHKVPNGYCGLKGTGVACSIPAPPAEAELPTSEEEWRARLTSEQYAVLREAGTERAFSGEYVDTDDDGVYRCAACGNELFDSRTKYHSGSGWPSFTAAVSPDAVELLEDRSHGMIRTEVRCARCHSHLGHVFPDGPVEAGGQRYCMNSVAMDLERRPG
jgi:peptide-methionine (S)-S-oxide reductase